MSNIGNKETMSKNLKYYISKSGKDRRELSEIWGFPYSTVTEWINGRKYPRIDRIQVMADYFGCEMSDLIEDKEKSPSNDGLTENQRLLLDFVKNVPDEKAALVLRTMRAILQDD